MTLLDLYPVTVVTDSILVTYSGVIITVYHDGVPPGQVDVLCPPICDVVS